MSLRKHDAKREEEGFGEESDNGYTRISVHNENAERPVKSRISRAFRFLKKENRGNMEENRKKQDTHGGVF